MLELGQYEAWFVTGSQHLRGPETLRRAPEHSEEIAAALSRSAEIPVKVAFKPVLTGPDEIVKLCLEANSAPECVGLITWMHTFSPAKMWIGGLRRLQKPFVHLHAQYNRDIPWSEIDMNSQRLEDFAEMAGIEFLHIDADTRLPAFKRELRWNDIYYSRARGH